MMVCGPRCVTGTGHSSTPMSSVDPPLVTGRALLVIMYVHIVCECAFVMYVCVCLCVFACVSMSVNVGACVFACMCE